MLDVDACAAFLSGMSSAGGPVPRGTPRSDVTRSPAAARTGALAADSGLFLSHFEHRVAAPNSEVGVGWTDGVLAEDKYAVFRHELPIGSFHPGHRAKWGTHELCHALVGFAMRPGASPLFIATAARLAELVPVVLWYFLDEVGLARCPRHTQPLFRTFCAECEEASRRGATAVVPERAVSLVRDAQRFLDGELAAVARTRRLGRPCPHVWGSLDLCSDGLAYAAAHGPRMSTDAFELWHERFFRPSESGHPALEDLEERLTAVARAIAEGRELSPLCPDPAAGRSRWIAKDLGARLLDVWELTEGDCSRGLLDLVDGLATGDAPAQVAQRYRGLAEDFVLPDPREVLAVGYDLGEPGEVVEDRSAEQVEEGLASVAPVTLELHRDASLDPVAPFLAADLPERRPLGVRFARWLEAVAPGPVAQLAHYEAALRSASAEVEARALGTEGEGWRLVSGAVVVRADFDPVALAERASSGEVEGECREGALWIDAPASEPTTLVIARDLEGQLVIADVDADLDAVGVDGLQLEPHVRDGLVELGLLVPRRWPVG